MTTANAIAKVRKRDFALPVFFLLTSSFIPSSVYAEEQLTLDQRLKDIQAQLKAQEIRLEAQEASLARQQKALSEQYAKFQKASGRRSFLISDTTLLAEGGVPTTPVGEAPKKDEEPPQVIQSLPEGLAVLTPSGHFVAMPSIEYTHTANDRLVYRGVVIVPGINLGEVEASTDSRNFASAVADLRYGLFDRLEVEVRVPFTWSDDRATVLSQGPQGSATQNMYLKDAGIGDIEVGARYQINRGLDDWPIFVANARVKTDTGMGPFDIQRDPAGIAQQVALGSGFMGLEGGFSMLKLTDPAVLFASVNYIYQVPKNINQTIGNVLVGNVDPSNSISTTLGFGFAVNPDFSFSMGYEHSYVLPQYTVLGGIQQHTTSIQVGDLTFGLAYKLSPTLSFNTNFEFGVTSDAPDMRVVFSFPTTF